MSFQAAGEDGCGSAPLIRGHKGSGLLGKECGVRVAELCGLIQKERAGQWGGQDGPEAKGGAEEGKQGSVVPREVRRESQELRLKRKWYLIS